MERLTKGEDKATLDLSGLTQAQKEAIIKAAAKMTEVALKENEKARQYLDAKTSEEAVEIYIKNFPRATRKDTWNAAIAWCRLQ